MIIYNYQSKIKNLLTGIVQLSEYNKKFCVSATRVFEVIDDEKLQEIDGIRIIGHITKPELGCAMITRDGNELELQAQGWNAFKNNL